uniref:Family with sequence similarity 219 member B n=1 Tax=Capra hircus TaxID=9925 RepID=A0A8C2RBD2_CAPHI
MATADPDGQAAPSIPGPRPSGTEAAGLPSGRGGIGAPRLGERIPAAVEKRGPYMVARAPSIQAKLQKHRDLAKAVLRRKGMLGAAPNRPDSSGKRSVKFNKGYTALSQSPDENLVSLDSDRAAASEHCLFRDGLLRGLIGDLAALGCEAPTLSGGVILPYYVCIISDSDSVPAGAKKEPWILMADYGFELCVMESWNPDTPPGIPLQSR